MAELRKLFGNRNNFIMLIILIIGLAVTALPELKKAAKTETETVTDIGREEERLSEILSEIKGAGRVSVMITYESTMEKDIAYSGDNERAVTSGGDVVVRREIYPPVKGVIVVADGADDPSVCNALKAAVTAVTGAAANHICIYSFKDM